MANASDDRRLAARFLIRVDDGAFASRLLQHGSSPGTRARVLGVLRWRRDLDHRLGPFLKHPLDRLDPEVRAALRLGVFEGTRLGVPAPVATDAMVRLIRVLKKASASGMVNAVLRRALAAPVAETGPDLRWSHPRWLWRRWKTAFGSQAAEGAMAAAQEPAPPWVWFAGGDARAALESAGVTLRSHPWCPDAWTAPEDRGELLAHAASGAVVIQDPSSQIAARLAAQIVDGTGRAIDLCAAPGGKTMLLDRLGDWDSMVACDLSVAKTARLGRRLGGGRIVTADAARPPMPSASCDLVLLDAPCSGTGTLRRHPELKWRLTEEAIEEAAAQQRPMVAAALDLLASGGVLVYATCSIETEENEAHFADLPDEVNRVDLDEILPAGMPWSPTNAGGVRILPHEHGDGFTIHALCRRG